ncbi:protein transport protein SEC13 [Nematocida displodere]|uniref:Protein transport protein SEC13 n=1 Tax=Nematocida displodere TaxID=1805483 RepID=A0A177ECX6_9MICR|nr:protein transport protein SEC13 [Nematocida displodere]
MSIESSNESIVYNLCENEDGSMCAGACEDGSVKVFKVKDSDVVLQQNLSKHKAAVFDVMFLGSKIVSSSYDGELCIWKEEGGAYALESCVLVFQGGINTLGKTADGSKILCGCTDGRLRVVSLTGEALSDCYAHRYGVTGVGSFDEYLVTCGMDGTTKIWKESDLSLVSELKDHQGPIRDCKVCPNPYGSVVFATCSDDGAAIVYTKKEGTEFARARIALGSPCTKVAWSKAGCALAIGYGEGKGKVYLPNGPTEWKESTVVMP